MSNAATLECPQTAIGGGGKKPPVIRIATAGKGGAE